MNIRSRTMWLLVGLLLLGIGLAGWLLLPPLSSQALVRRK